MLCYVLSVKNVERINCCLTSCSIGSRVNRPGMPGGMDMEALMKQMGDMGGMGGM